MEDPVAKQLLTELSMTPSNEQGYTLANGIIYYHGRWVGTNELAQNHIIQALHAGGIGGYSRIYATYH